MSLEAKPLKTYENGGIYESLNYGTPYPSKGLRFSRWLGPSYPLNAKILCVGCGCGYEVVEWIKAARNAYGTELHDVDVPILKNRIIRAVVPYLPFKDKSFDLVLCCEVLEHIEEDQTDEFLKECGRVGKNCFFSIATRPDPPFNTHINLHDLPWWYDKMRACFRIKNMQLHPTLDLIIAPNKYAKFTYMQGITAHVDQNF